MKKIFVIVIVLFPLMSFSQFQDQHIAVHFYPHALSPQDSLQDGPFGKYLDIHEDTFLVWVDLFPGMFFTHETAYIFISKGDIQIVRGDWWPVLNGKSILHNEHEKYAVFSPFELSSFSDDGLVDDRIDIHVCPQELTSQDTLTDGPTERLFRIDDNCLLIWIDLLPDAYYIHPTAYVFVSKNNIRAEYGDWWPELNGKRILYGRQNRTGIISPFKITSFLY
jgi:hypothetical protein